LDLQFPHHENEIAQSEAVSGKCFANYWIHVGMLQINNEKMAKSTGNFFTIEDVLKKFHPEVIRYFLLSSHYRSPLNYSEETIQLAGRALMRLYQSVKDMPHVSNERDGIDENWLARYNDAMNDDFNTPIALSILFELSHEINKTKSETLAKTLKYLAGTLGLLEESTDSFFQAGFNPEEIKIIEQLIDERLTARRQKEWHKADEIRKTLLDKGVELEDGPEGTIWRMV
jgi:cysteinyl-tRNA synthetase